MKKNIISLISGGAIVKLLALFYKMFLVRILSIEGMSLYSIMIPTIMLFLGIADFALPNTITKLVCENQALKIRNKALISKALLIGILIDIFLIIILILGLPFFNKIAQANLTIPYLMLIPLIPLVTINAIIKGYYQGINRSNIPSIANVIEQLTRIIFALLFLYNNSLEYALIGIILSMSVGELASLLYSLVILGKRSYCPQLIKNDDARKIIFLSLPSSLNRLIYSISNFLEPIIFTNALIKYWNHNDILKYFALINSYAIPLLAILGFIVSSISISIMPKMTKAYKLGNTLEFNDCLKIGLLLSFLVGGLQTIILLNSPKLITFFLYNDSSCYEMVVELSLVFILYYLEPILQIGIIVINKAKASLYISIVVLLIKLCLIYFLSTIFYGKGLIYALIISIIITFISYYFLLYSKTKLKLNINKPLLFLIFNLIFIFFLPKESIFSLIVLFINYSLFGYILFKRRITIFFNNK